jgi:isoquinoline 1-oxidoreductase alpha subunit
MSAVHLKVNGQARRVDVDLATPLLWLLRDHLGLTGTKFGCGIAQCGACTVHLNGQAVRSCQVQAADVNGADVTTIEGLSPTGDHVLQKLWMEMNVPQCGYCQAGMLMAASDLMKNNAKPSDTDIDEAMTNICRCGTYPRIRAAIRRASGQEA